MTNTAKWDVFDTAFTGPHDGNPYLDVSLSATFSHGSRTVTVPGFYDGDGTYRVRFSPDTEGEWRYTTRSATPALNGQAGSFTCTPATPDVHGPVHVAHRFHFAYADGTPYFPFGTTSYAWTHQPLAIDRKSVV